MSAPEASFHVLDLKKARRMNAKTLYIPSALDVARAISAIPTGETGTIVDLRNELAALGNAETACPAKTIKYWYSSPAPLAKSKILLRPMASLDGEF